MSLDAILMAAAGISMMAAGFLLILVLIVRDYRENKERRRVGDLIKACVIVVVALLVLVMLAVFVFFSSHTAKTPAPVGGEVEFLLYQVPQEQEVVKIKSF